MKEYFSSLDTHYNDFIENRLNVLSKQINHKNAEYKNKKKCADELFNTLLNSLPKNNKDKLSVLIDIYYDIATFDLHKVYTLGFMDACQIRKKYE